MLPEQKNMYCFIYTTMSLARVIMSQLINILKYWISSGILVKLTVALD